jgi:hypothetical protein
MTEMCTASCTTGTCEVYCDPSLFDLATACGNDIYVCGIPCP